MKIISRFSDYYDDAARSHPSDLIIDRKGGEDDPILGARLYGDADPYQVMLQLAGVRHYGVFQYDRFYWGDDAKALGTVVLENSYFYVRIRCRGSWETFMYGKEKTTHPHPLLWSYAAPSVPTLLTSNTRPWPRLAKIQTQSWLPAEEIVNRLHNFHK